MTRTITRWAARGRRGAQPDGPSRPGWRGAATAGGIAALVGALGTAGMRASVAAPQSDGISITHLGWRDIDFGGRRLTRLTGLVVNDGPAAVGEVELAARFRAAQGSPVLRIGTTIADLPELAPGEASPFTILVGPLEASAVGHVDVTTLVRAADGRRYRDLAVEDIVTRTVGGMPALFGWLSNRGETYASATNTNIVAGFWDERGLRETRAATMPIVYQPGTLVGQGHAPGVRYPWFLRLPDERWTRIEFWVVAKHYADGTWPVPLGVVDVARDDRDGIVAFTGRLVHCGVRPVTEFALVSSAAAAGGSVLTYTLNFVAPPRPITPGADLPVRITWAGLDPAIPLDRIVHLPLALDEQPLPPYAMPCSSANRGRRIGVLPWLGRNSERAFGDVPAVDPAAPAH